MFRSIRDGCTRHTPRPSCLLSGGLGSNVRASASHTMGVGAPAIDVNVEWRRCRCFWASRVCTCRHIVAGPVEYFSRHVATQPFGWLSSCGPIRRPVRRLRAAAMHGDQTRGNGQDRPPDVDAIGSGHTLDEKDLSTVDRLMWSKGAISRACGYSRPHRRGVSMPRSELAHLHCEESQTCWCTSWSSSPMPNLDARHGVRVSEAICDPRSIADGRTYSKCRIWSADSRKG